LDPAKICVNQLLWRCAACARKNGLNSRTHQSVAPLGLGTAGRLHHALLVVVCLLGCALAVAALEPTTPLASYGRQSWGMENGLPQNTVQALAQTRDGYIWLGTEVGLVRFDGNSFAVFDKNSTPALPGADVRCLLETKDGALWIGTSEGLARWKDGTVAAFTTKEGLPGNGILALVELPDGKLKRSPAIRNFKGVDLLLQM